MPSQSEWMLIVCGGGSGGHLYPALAVVEELRSGPNPPRRVLFLTSRRVVESRVLSGWDVESISLPAVTARELATSPWIGVPKLWSALRGARTVVRPLSPAVAIGTGGFASVPGILAAARSRTPIVLLEQNVVMGRANAFLTPFASAVCLGFSGDSMRTSRHVTVTGNPVRAAIARLLDDRISLETRRTLLVLGGSQGSRAVHQAMLDVVSADPAPFAGWNIVHQAPTDGVDAARLTYDRAGIEHRVEPFFSDLPTLYGSTGLAVSRAGATSLAEFACGGIPTVLIPDPRSVRDHQRLNAVHFVRSGGAVLVEERECPTAGESTRLRAVLGHLLTDSVRRAEMSAAMTAAARPGAAAAVARTVRGFVEGRGGRG